MAIDNLLLYASLGVAGANADLDITSDDLDSPAHDNQTHYGAAFGVGAEYALDKQWTIGIDYKHLSLGSAAYSDPSAIDGTATVDLSTDVVTARLNYRF